MGRGQKKLYASVVVPPAPVHGAIGWCQKSFMQVWWCHQLLQWSHRLVPKKLHASVVVTPAPVHGAMGWGQKSFMQVWWYHKLLSM
jgi:hypothetical protein